MTTSNYIYTTYNERGMKSFEKRISEILKSNGIEGNAIAHNAYMERASGSGSYYKVAEIEINGHDYKLRSFTHDSEMWDNFEGDSKEKRQLFEAVISEKMDLLLEEIKENQEYYAD